MAVSCHLLDLRNHGSVFCECESVASRWSDLAVHLEILRYDVEEIKTDFNSCRECLKQLIDKWLRGRGNSRSWKSIYEALKIIDVPLSKSILLKHQCSCFLCTKRKCDSEAIKTVSTFYDQIYSVLNFDDLMRVLEYMKTEKALDDSDVQRIKQSPTSKRNEVHVESLFPLLESAISSNEYNLKIFATALMYQDSTKEIGNELLSAYRAKDLSKHPISAKEIIVETKYKKEFITMRSKLGKLCHKTIKLLGEKKVDLSDIISELTLAFTEYKIPLGSCKSVDEIITEVIRPEITVIEFELLEVIYEMFDLPVEPIKEYKKTVDSFCSKMQLEHTYGQLLLDELKPHVSKFESIIFVLDWRGNEHNLNDLKDLFKNLVRELKKDMKVRVIYEGNSIVVECYVNFHSNALSLIVQEIIENQERIDSDVIRITANGIVIYERPCVGQKRIIQLELPSVTRHITQVLEKCPVAQILKELLQNADDAEASEVKFILDSSEYPTDHLIHKNLSEFQGPALYAWNNAKFEDKDWDHFGKIEESSKENNALKIGRFGVGFLSVFHITDLPIVISNKTAAILDPHLNIGTDKLGYSCPVQEFLEYRSHAACFEKLPSCSILPGTAYYPHTLFRFPLRSPRAVTKSKISSNVYQIDHVRSLLFEPFTHEAPLILLFLKHVQKISLYDGDRLIFEVSIHPHHKETVKLERNALAQFDKSKLMYPSVRIYAMTISVDNFGEIKSQEMYHWLVFNMIGSSINKIQELSKKLKFLPWVGVAAPLPKMLDLKNICVPDIDNLAQLSNVLLTIERQVKMNEINLPYCEVHGYTTGHAFCFLPLPNPTPLPISVHGYFGVSDDRRTIDWPANDNKSDKAIWNQELLLRHVVPLYSLLIACRSKIIRYENTPVPSSEQDKNISDAYAAWPLSSEFPIWSELIKPTIAGCLNYSVFWSAINKWVTKNDAVFLHEPGIPAIAIEVLVNANVPVVNVPKRIWQTLKKYQLIREAKLTMVSPTHVRDAYRNKRFVFHSFEIFKPFLEYILSDIQGNRKFKELFGLKIIPLTRKKFKLQTLLTRNSENEPIYFLNDTMSEVCELLPGIESCLVDSLTIDSQVINCKLFELAKSKEFQLQLGTPELFCQKLLPSSIQEWTNFKHNEPITWEINRSGSPPFKWIVDVWKWFSKYPDMITKVVGIPILPKKYFKIDTVSGCCTLLPIPSSNNKYYWRNDDDTELTCLLEKLEATVVAVNDFVFRSGKLSRFILNINISNILSYISKKPEKLLLLQEREKIFLLVCIAQEFSKKGEKKDLLQVVCELPIFQLGVGSTATQFASLNSSTCKCVLLPSNMNFDEKLEYPQNFLKIMHTDVFSLLTKVLSYPILPKVEVYEKILQFAMSQIKDTRSVNNGDKLITWVLKTESAKLPSKLKTLLSSHRFVRTRDKNLKMASELYDPRDDNFITLCSLDEGSMFPDKYYNNEGALDVLVSLGLNTWAGLTSNLKAFCKFLQDIAKEVEHSSLKESVKAFEVSCHILETIGKYSKGSVELMSAVESVKFLKVQVSPPSNFPKCLPWNGEEYKDRLVAPNKVCFERMKSNLIGCVLPLVHEEYDKKLTIQLPKTAIKKFLVPTVKNITKQLEVLIEFEQRVNPEELSALVHEIYQYLNDSSEDVLKFLPKNWVWWRCEENKFRFMSPKMFVLDFDIDLSPFMYVVMSEDSFFMKYDRLVKKSGIKTFPTYADLVDVLKKMSSLDPTRPLSEINIKMAVSILQHLFLKKERKESMLIPTIDNMLLPVNKCAYDDREWIKKKIGSNKITSSQYNFVHGNISPNVAEFFGVQPLSKKVAPSKELRINYQQVGQKESLTHRLNGIVNDYNEEIDIFKELIQNADDAGATKVKFLMDWRKHGEESLFNDEMRCWQGPALISYNDSTFSDQDFADILNIAGESKTSDPLKIGRYGLGFCACYSLTDVPSLISRCLFTMFDPHTHYLDNRVSPENAGVQINLFKEKVGVSIYEDQFAPYKGLFDCNIDTFKENGFDGTLFRFPLRMQDHRKSEISNEFYDRKRISEQIKKLQKESTKLLIFLKQVKSIEFFQLEEASSIKEMQLLFKVAKNDDIVRAEMIQSHISDARSVLEYGRCRVTIENYDSEKETKQEILYLVSSAIVHECKVKKGMLPLAEVAVEILDNYTPVVHTHGQFFCFLPLPLNHSMPFFFNGYFDVTKDRKTLRDPQDGTWNRTMMEKVLPVAFEYLLDILAKKANLSQLSSVFRETFLQKFYSLWPNQIDGGIVENVRSSIIDVLRHSKKSLFWSDAKGGVWLQLEQTHVFDQSESIPQYLQDSAIEILVSSGVHIVNCPKHVLEIIRGSEQLKTINYLTFFKEAFLTQIKKIDWNCHIQFVLKMINDKQTEFLVLVESMKKLKCIPVANSNALVYPKDLIDVSCDQIAKLFHVSDNCFPHEDFRNDSYTKALITLGMVTKELPIETLVERASSVCNLNHDLARERIKHLLQYICHLEELECENNVEKNRVNRIKALSSIKFLMMVPKPTDLSIPWYNANDKFFSPSQLYSFNDKYLVFTQKPIFHSPFPEDHPLFNIVEKYLGINFQQVEIVTVLKNVNCLIDDICGKTNMVDSKQDFLNKVFIKIYDFLNHCCNSDDANKNIVVSSLSKRQCVWQNGRLHYPHQILFQWNGTEYYPYVSPLSKENKTFEILFDLLGVKKEADFVFLKNALLDLNKSFKSRPLSDNAMEFILRVNLVNLIDDRKSDSIIDTEMFLPDADRVLRRATDLMYCDVSLRTDQSKQKNIPLVHESIPRHIAIKFGACSTQDVVLQDMEDIHFVKKTGYGQCKDLVEQLNNLLKPELPSAESILNQFVQIAEYSQTNEIAFVLDHRTDHPNQYLISETEAWKGLQNTQALCIFYNKQFDEEDIRNLCRVGQNGTGAIGFNVAYHMSDCPCLVSFDESGSPIDFYVFDPLQAYCPSKASKAFIRRWTSKEKQLNQFHEQFEPFLFDKFEEMRKLSTLSFNDLTHGFTVIRLPITHLKQIKEVQGDIFQEAKIKSFYHIQNCIKLFSAASDEILLFLKNLKLVSVFEIRENDQVIHHVSTASIESTLISNNTSEVLLRSFLSTNNEKESKWLINESSEKTGLKHFKSMLSDASSRGLQPYGSTALQLSYDNECSVGWLYNSVRSCINSSVPVYMNASFLVNSSSSQLVTPSGLEKWNNFLFRTLLVPSYVELILQARKYVNINNVEWYYSLFPSVIVASENNPECTGKHFYEALVSKNHPILLDGRVKDDIHWLKITEEEVGYFCIPDHDNIINYDLLCQILLNIGMPITLAPKFVYENLLKFSKRVRAATAKEVCHYLKSINEEQRAMLQNVVTCVKLLYFCSRDTKGKDLKIVFKGVPLLLTINGMLDTSGSLYESTFASLLPNMKEKFIHPQLEKSDVIIDVIKQIVVRLPFDIVAQNILLPDTDKSMNLNTEQTELVKSLWSFFEASMRPNDPDDLQLISKLFSKKPIIPTSTGLYYPLCISKCVFGVDQKSDYDLIRKLGYPISNAKVGLPKHIISVFISSASNSNDMIECMKNATPKTTEKFNTLEVNRFLILVSSASKIPSNISNLLKDLPVFRAIDGSYHCLNDTECVYIVDNHSNLVSAGLSKIQKTTKTLVLNEDVYKTLIPHCQYLTNVQLYAKLILPNLNCFTMKELKKHLYVIRNWISEPEDISCDEIENIKRVLKLQCFIDIKGRKYCPSELYDPAVLFHVTFNKNKLPPEDSWKGDWLVFLRSLGLQSNVEYDDWLQSARHVAEKGSACELRHLPGEVVKESDILLKTLQKLIVDKSEFIDDEIENLSTELFEFLQAAATIHFICYSNNDKHVNHLEKALNVIADESTMHRKPLVTCFSGSVLNQDKSVILLLSQSVLPQSCEVILKFNCIKNALSVNILSKHLIVENLIDLSKRMCDISFQPFVSEEKKHAIQIIREVFKDYYRNLNSVDAETAASDLFKNLCGKRCVLLCPNDFCFQLVQPSQLVMHISDTTELQPFCYQVPPDLHEFGQLWRALDVKVEIDCTLCFQIFSDIKNEMGIKQLDKSDPYWDVCMGTYVKLISILRSSTNVNVPSNMNHKWLLPSDNYSLVKIADLVFNDVPRIRDRLQKLKNFKYKFICSPPPDQMGMVTLPKILGVRLLSTVTSEELHNDVLHRLNRCKEQELFELKKRRYNCTNTEKIKDTFVSDKFQKGLSRLYWHQHKKDPALDHEFQQKLKDIKSLSLCCVAKIKTIAKFQGVTIEGTENSSYLCYMMPNLRKILLSHNLVYIEAFWQQLANIISTYLNKCIAVGAPLVAILSCSPMNIDSVLTELNVPIIPGEKTLSIETDFDVGMEIPLSDIIHQSIEDLLILINLSKEEKVLYHRIVNGKPNCVVARIHECPLQNCIDIRDKYVQIYLQDHVGKGPTVVIKVSILQVYKILNTSQRKMLIDDRSTKYDKPLFQAKLPEDQEMLFTWISQTLKYNNSNHLCSSTQLSKRMLSHMYYYLVKSRKQTKLYLTAAEHVLETIKWLKLPYTTEKAVVMFVQGLDGLSIDENSVFAKQPQATCIMQPHVQVPQQTQPDLYGQMYNIQIPWLNWEGHRTMERTTDISTRPPPMSKRLVQIAFSGKSRPDQFAAKAWINQAKVDFMAAIDILMDFKDVQDTIMAKDAVEQVIGYSLSLSKEMESGGVGESLQDQEETKCKYPALVCFLCHDVLEKFIKGILYFKVGVPSHLLHCKNLIILVDELIAKTYDTLPKKLLNAIQACVFSISIHANKSRYPSFHYPPSSPAALYNEIEAMECLQNVKKMMIEVLEDEDTRELVGDMQHIEYETFKTAGLKSIHESKAIPEFWTPHDETDGKFKLVLLDEIDNDVGEYNFVLGAFEATLSPYHCEIERIERIQNKLLWQRYYDCVKRMLEYNHGVANEMNLFHGTKEIDPEKIYKGDSGFDMRFSKVGLWGKGNYFAVNASYSDDYAHECADDRRQMLMANVLTGYHFNSPRDKNLTKPPIRDTSDEITRLYDSVSGAAGGSKIFITYDNDKAYPAYLITYRRNKKD